jgi:type II secretory pathway pseudopilin PulG
MARPSTRDDRGETLVELMVALVIMATAVVALVGGIATSVQASDIHRKQAKSQAYLREFVEKLEASMATYPTGYVECGASSSPAATYQGLRPTTDAGYVAEVTGVSLWSPATNPPYTACPAAGDSGVQRVSLQVRTSDGRATEKLDIILRKPCRPPADAPLDPSIYQDSLCS